MKTALVRAIIVGQGVLIAALIWGVSYLGRDEFKLYAEREGAAATHGEAVRTGDTGKEGTPIVSVSDAMREGSSIVIARVHTASWRATRQLAGVVLSTQPLLEQAARTQSLQAEDKAAQAQLRRAKAEYERIVALHADDRNASERTLQAAEAEYRSAQAHATATRQAAQAQQVALRAAWGIADMARVPLDMEALARQRQVLLQIAFEPGERSAPGRLSVRPAGGGGEREARLAGRTTQGEGGLAGTTFLYVADAAGLRPGMRLMAAMPVGQGSRSGVVVPASALVWHSGRAWIYVQVPEHKPDKDKATEFSRRDVTDGEWAGEGWFTSALDSETEIVTRGAQLLLSEELRGQIKNENED